MNYSEIISSDILSANLNLKDLVIVDCRFELKNPEKGYQDYLASHIPGAYYANLDKDLASPATSISGRHPLPDSALFSDLLSRWGVTVNSQVVVYDQNGGSLAVRLWWLLNYFGFSRVAVLDGGFSHWLDGNFPVDNQTVQFHKQDNLPPLEPNTQMMVPIEEMTALVASPDYLIIDARAEDRYLGKLEPIDKIAGHIPGAVNRFHGCNLTYEGLFKSPEKLRMEFLSLIGNRPYSKVIVYCGSGVTSCHHILSMKMAGISGPRLYVGSWSEWIQDPSRQIAAL